MQRDSLLRGWLCAATSVLVRVSQKILRFRNIIRSKLVLSVTRSIVRQLTVRPAAAALDAAWWTAYLLVLRVLSILPCAPHSLLNHSSCLPSIWIRVILWIPRSVMQVLQCPL
jgi:hypothetical protein